MNMTDESFQRLSEGDIGIDVDPIPVTNEDIIKNSRVESSNTGASARFIDTSVGMIDVSMVRTVCRPYDLLLFLIDHFCF